MIRNLIAYIAIFLKSSTSLKYTKEGKIAFNLPYNQVQAIQYEKYKKLILYAYENTEYYREVFNKIGLIEKGNVIDSKISEIPILTKEIIRKEGNRLVSKEFKSRGAYTNTSGGSTGEPVLFYQDKLYFANNFGDKILYGILNDKRPGDKEIKLWGSERDIIAGSIGIKEKIINWIYNRTFLNSFVLSEDNIASYIETINKKKPVQIWTYADSIYQLARYINENKVDMFCPKNIISTAGVLYEEMREEIQKAFPKSRILNQYGSREAGVIACEVGEKRGLRIFEHSVKIEILNYDNQEISNYGEGELLVTNLTNFSMPLIRFKIGDTGNKTTPEGYDGGFSVLKNVTGRTNTHLKKKDGTLVHGEYATHLFYGKKWIEVFKVIQHDYDDIEFQIVIKGGMKVDEGDINTMICDLQKVMGDCNVRISYVDSIPRLSSGKYQFVVTEIKE